ncbi:MAG: PfkB family carbohydrate kinase [Gammaproteobacteria bacterium]|nr:PfkB family carbohydrate kinase [Gammaproteobacteria bacterium]
MARILCIGNLTLDIVNIVDGYPREDEEKRALQQRRVRGGNVGNTLVVLKQYGHECHWCGTLASDSDGRWIKEELNTRGIHTREIVIHNGATPVSHIILNKQNGSRTIVHYRNLPELASEQIVGLDFAQFDWLHLEARNCIEQLQILKMARAANPDLKISIEVEKFRDHIERLFSEANFIFFSKHFSLQKGFDNGNELFVYAREFSKDAYMSCTWGEYGIFYSEPSLDTGKIESIKVDAITDSIGAGDTFNAGVINSLLEGKSFVESVKDGNRLAAKKLAQYGFDNLVN